MLETRITACVNGECVSDMPGSESMVGNRIVYIGTWESHIASQSSAIAKLKKQRQMHSDMAVGLTLTKLALISSYTMYLTYGLKRELN